MAETKRTAMINGYIKQHCRHGEIKNSPSNTWQTQKIRNGTKVMQTAGIADSGNYRDREQATC
jgi:hypothetical protein